MKIVYVSALSVVLSIALFMDFAMAKGDAAKREKVFNGFKGCPTPV
jgi:hypothetical protein